MGSLPWSHTSFLLQASAGRQKSQCLRGQPRGAGRRQAAPLAPVLFCSLEGEQFDQVTSLQEGVFIQKWKMLIQIKI